MSYRRKTLQCTHRAPVFRFHTRLFVPENRQAKRFCDLELRQAPPVDPARTQSASHHIHRGAVMWRADELRRRAREAGKRAHAAASGEERALLEQIEAGLNDLAAIEERLESLKRT
jgi:hypothetical protein